jgi:hypothetical protein
MPVGRLRQPSRRPRRRAVSGGFFSSASRFQLLPGSHIAADGVRGYYIDLTMKATEPRWPAEWFAPGRSLYVGATQWGLGALDRFYGGEGEAWREGAIACGRDVARCVDEQGALVQTAPYPHTFLLEPPWISAMAQGQAASLLVRLAGETGEDAFVEVARRCLAPLARSTADGGVGALLDGRPWPEEYPTSPHSFVLNGGIFAIWGYRDVGVALDDSAATAEFERLVDTLALNIHRWDLGYWSRYDLFPHPLVNVASSSYHVLHMSQLRVMNELAPRPQLAAAHERFAVYWHSRACRARAFAMKALFRLRVPRRRA